MLQIVVVAQLSVYWGHTLTFGVPRLRLSDSIWCTSSNSASRCRSIVQHHYMLPFGCCFTVGHLFMLPQSTYIHWHLYAIPIHIVYKSLLRMLFLFSQGTFSPCVMGLGMLSCDIMSVCVDGWVWSPHPLYTDIHCCNKRALWSRVIPSCGCNWEERQDSFPKHFCQCMEDIFIFGLKGLVDFTWVAHRSWYTVAHKM